MNVLLNAIKLFVIGCYIDITQKSFDFVVLKSLENRLNLSGRLVNILSQNLYNHKIKFIKLQNKTDIAIANYSKM